MKIQMAQKLPMKKSPEKPPPPGVPESLLAQIKDFISKSSPCVVDPELFELAKKDGHAPNFVPVPYPLIVEHVRKRRDSGASEQSIELEVGYLLEFFEQSCRETTF